VVPSVVDLVALYYDNNGVIDPKIYLDNFIWLENHRKKTCKDRVSIHKKESYRYYY